MTDEHLVSIIIPTKNSERTIEICLKSVKEQTYPNIEIIIVDNHSIDKTREIAETYGKVYVKGPERSSQRNFGAKKAAGDYLFFVDSDMELSPEVIEECVWKMRKENVHAVIIPEMSVGESFWAKCKALEKSCYIGDETIEAARFFDRRIFWKFNGYDEEIAGGGEDWDLPLRLKKAGYKIARIAALIKHHEGELTLSDSIRKKYYYAKTMGRYIKRHPDFAKKQLTPFRQAFFRNGIKLVADPLHALGLVLMKFCEFSVGGLGLIIGKTHGPPR